MNNLKPPFQLGEKVWVATANPYAQEQVVCPVCAGNRYVTMILGDGTHEHIECQACCRGWEGSTGRTTIRRAHSSVREATVTGVTYEQHKDEWRIECDGHTEHDIFRDKILAEKARQALHDAAEEAAKRNNEAVITNDKRDTAHSAYYHRKEIKELERRLEWHRAKLTAKKAAAQDDAGD